MKVRKKPSGRVTVDPTRMALAAMERIQTVLARKGHADRFGPPATMRDLAARAEYLGRPLPPSYSAAMRAAGAIGEPEILLPATEMKRLTEEVFVKRSELDAERYAPFCRIGEKRYVCFDRSAHVDDGELPIVEWTQGIAKPRARHFGEWLDMVADKREEAVERAAEIPHGLRRLLLALGFTFDDPIVGRLETGDTEAIEELIGPETAGLVRADVDRLFDSSGKASLTLNVDEFSLAIALRTGIYVFEAEDVFRWLRYFRDEAFFGESHRSPSHPDKVRDLRRAPREPPLVLRGVLEVPSMAATKHHFRAAAGRSPDDFYLLGRTHSTSDRSPSLLLHVVDGVVKGAHSLDEPLLELYVAKDNAVWGLSHSSTAIRLQDGAARAFPLNRTTRGRTRWYGIGGGGVGAHERVLVWGAGALLDFDGERFAPFRPDALLEEHEAVLALAASRRELAMLVCGDHVGAVARFDGRRWLPIGEEQLIEGPLVDLDVWRGITIVLARTGEVWRIETGQAPRPVPWDKQPAFVAESGTLRPTYAVRGFDGGALIASDGGVIAVGGGSPVFHAAQETFEPARLARVGVEGDPKGQGLVATCGPHAWIWQKDQFAVIDPREW